MRYYIFAALFGFIWLVAAPDAPWTGGWIAIACLGLFCAYLLRRIDRQEKKLAALERSLLAMSKEKRVQMRAVSPPTLRTPDSLRDAPVRPGVSRPEPEEVFLFSPEEEVGAASPDYAALKHPSVENPLHRSEDTAASGIPRHTSAPRTEPAGEIPEWLETIPGRVRGWLLGGNPVAKAGLVILFFGVSFLLKYAVDRQLLPTEVRLAGAFLLGAGLLVLGWRQRETRRLYAHLLQGGGVGILYLTVFASVRLLDFFSPLTGLVLMTAVVLLSGILAVSQNAPSLAVFGTAGGFLAPILMSTGQGNHVQLFSYYALLNTGILGMAWFRRWRFLVLLGFFFTFGIGTIWGVLAYSPERFVSTEPFLVLFFTMYSVISILFAWSGPSGERDRLDSMLVFGLPLVVFSLQMHLVSDTEMGGAYSALVLALWYLGTAVLFRRVRGPELLAEAHLALGVIFLSLAVPLAFDARYTASTWALEGAGMIWIGLRQKRLPARLFGILLQLGAVLAFFRAGPELPLAAIHLLPGLFLAVGGLFSHWSYERFGVDMDPRERAAASVLGIGGILWWYASWAGWICGLEYGHRFIAGQGLTAGSLAVWILLYLRAGWTMPGYVMALNLPFAFFSLALIWPDHPGSHWGWIGWPLALAAQYAALYVLERDRDRLRVSWLHAGMLVLLALLVAGEIRWQADRLLGVPVWTGFLTGLGGMALLLGTAFSPAPAWPLARWRASYMYGSVFLVAGLGAYWLRLCIESGNPVFMPYVPVLNPADLFQVLSMAAVLLWARKSRHIPGLEWSAGATSVLACAVFVWLNAATARAAHFWAEVPYTFGGLLRSPLLQAVWSLLWALSALACMVSGWRKERRERWLAGAVLLGMVVVKLFLVDLSGRGTIPRIVSFLAVGLLMLVVGYFCPLPPRKKEQ